MVLPRFLKIYHGSAVSLTNWENHAHQSTYDASLTLKTFSLAALADYLGLALSAFVYVPFGEEVMAVVQNFIERDASRHISVASAFYSRFSPVKPVATAQAAAGAAKYTVGMWEQDVVSARKKLSPTRLQDQMFASTVTNQVVNAFMEVGLPYVLRGLDSLRRGRGLGLSGHGAPPVSGKKKRVSFEDQPEGSEPEKPADGREERVFMEEVWRQVDLPDYELFQDYSEMVTQFGYVALWSTIWPLAPGESSHNVLSFARC